MVGPGRRELLCHQAVLALTGLDFLWVNPANHRELAVFFVIEPGALVRPVNTALTEFTATITGLEDGRVIAIDSYSWVSRVDATGAARLTLTLLAHEDGGFQTYRLDAIDTPADAGPSRIDPFSASLDFSFKQSCPSPFDCKPCCGCPPKTLDDYPVDYLARDFESYRTALSAFARDRYPDWELDTPADFGAMVAEMFAALGDEFAFVQDGIQREGYIDTLRERRSFNQLARLLDYRIEPAQSASGLVVLRLYAGDTRPPALPANLIKIQPGARIWAYQEDRPAIPFEIGDTIAQMVAQTRTWPAHTHWTDLAVYQPDPDTPCLEIGARELVLANASLLSTPFPAEVIGTDIAGYWKGRQVLIETRPTAPDEPVRRQLVTLDRAVVQLSDPLTGAGPLTRLHWREQDALTFGLDQGNAFVSANLVPVRGGEQHTADFVIGDSSNPLLADVPRTIERQGAMQADGYRPVIHRFPLDATAGDGLDWIGATDAAGAVTYVPEAVLRQLDPSTATFTTWTLGDVPLSLNASDEAATIEPGLYGEVARFERNGERIVHRDYIGDPGYTLRFGDGMFGRLPDDGDHFFLVWRSSPGQGSNVPADTITRIDAPPGAALSPIILPGAVKGVRNPFPFTNGRDPQSLDVARRIAPAAFKDIVFRAVRNEDYRAQAERLDWVSAAGAVTRWTGAWSTTFVAADPKGAFVISDEQMAELDARMGAVRQVGRPVIARQPVFVPLDLSIAICVTPGYAFGDVSKRILNALSAAPGRFFHPDRFTFGMPLRRPDLEAAVAHVEGVRAVMQVAVRQRGQTGWRLFDTPQISAAANRILKVESDPDRPGQGSVRVYDEELPASLGVGS
ncbi:hypothetical protein [Sphingomonas sp.]|uniref:hypothetical protein n=1 Tax=Sphingomonas sp. TaxID=28214 RepID=UPI003D6D2F56